MNFHVHKTGQRHDVQANVATLLRVTQNDFCQRRDIKIQRRDVTEGWFFFIFFLNFETLLRGLIHFLIKFYKL